MIGNGMKKVLFVCTGNICRSPTAEGVFRHMLHKEGMDKWVHADSVGLQGYHIGNPPDHRSQQIAGKRGYSLSGLRARRLNKNDFENFDLILAMDKGHLEHMRRHCPPEYSERIRLFMAYAPHNQHDEVPDPYYGSIHDFEFVLDLIEEGSKGLIEALKNNKTELRS